MAECIWCGCEVQENGDTCNLVCYGHAVEAINMVSYLEEEDSIKDMYLQPWYSALANTQEGQGEV